MSVWVPNISSGWPSLVRVTDAPAIVNPDPVAGLVFHPAIAVVVGQFAREMTFEQFAGVLQVGGVGQIFPGLDIHRGQLVQRIADDLRPTPLNSVSPV